MHKFSAQLASHVGVGIIQSSVKLGLVQPGATPLQVELVWKNLLAGTEIAPTTMHTVLWNWSRNKFLPEV